MDLITLVLIGVLGMASGTTTSGTSDTRATIIDSGATASAVTPTVDEDEERATIIDTGATSQ